MKTFQVLLILFLAIGISNAKASSYLLIEHEPNPTSDTSSEVKSNVVIFKLIPTPITNNHNNNSTNCGSLKKAGKVARTSYSHSSIENIIYKKKGI